MENFVSIVKSLAGIHETQNGGGPATTAAKNDDLLFQLAHRVLDMGNVDNLAADAMTVVDEDGKVKTAASSELLFAPLDTPVAWVCWTCVLLKTSGNGAKQYEAAMIEALAAAANETGAITQSEQDLVETLAFCYTKVYTILSPDPLELALKSVQSAGDNERFPRASAIALMSQLALATAGNADTATLRRRLLDAAFGGLRAMHHCKTTVQLVTRRIVIPLSANTTANDETTSIDSSSRASVLKMIDDLVAEGHRDDTVLLIAALFDVIFPPVPKRDPSQPQEPFVLKNPENDFRCSEVLWDILITGLRRVTASNEDPSKRQSLHNQIIYLLKRIVEYSTSQLCPNALQEKPDPASLGSKNKGKGKGARKRGVLKGDDKKSKHTDAAVVELPEIEQPPVVFHAEYFTFDPATSPQRWNDFFLVFESLSEYGLHLVEPAMTKINSMLPVKGAAPSIEPIWVETLFLKGLVHANTGCRRLALRYVWALDVPTFVAPKLSRKFVCESIFSCLADARICTDVDHAIVEGNFLADKAFEGRREETVPPLQPIANFAEDFYRQYVTAIVAAADGDVAEGRAIAMELLQVCSAPHTSRFGVSLMLRVLVGLNCKIANAALLQRLQAFVVEVIEDSHPNWLEARMEAMVVEAALNLSPPELLKSEELKALITRCGRNGCTGGRGLATIDASGTAGNTGSALRSKWLQQRLQALPPEVTAALLPAGLDVYTKDNACSEITAAKKLFTFVPLHTAADIATIEANVVANVASIISRPYANEADVHSAINAFSELSATLEEMATTAMGGSFTEEFLLELFAFLKRKILEPAERVVNTALTDAKNIELANSGGFASKLYAAEEEGGSSQWSGLSLDRCDEVCAAFTHVLRRLRQHGTSMQSLNIAQLVTDLVELLQKATTHELTTRSQLEYARMAVVRNILRAIDAVATACAIDSSISASAEGAEASTASKVSAAFWNGAFDNNATSLMNFATNLSKIDSPVLRVDDVPISELTNDITWNTVVNQAYRYQWDSILTLMPALEHYTQLENIKAPFKALIDACLDQLDICAVTNLSCACTIICAALPHVASPAMREQYISYMRSRMRDGMRRELFRCAALACLAAVQHLEPEAAVEVLEQTLEDNATTDRIVYFVSTAVASAVVQNPDACWDAFKPLLFQLALFTNSLSDDADLTACVALTDPILTNSAYPKDLRATLNPVVKMCGAARSAAIAAILHVCSLSPKNAHAISEELIQSNWEHPLLTHEPAMPNSKHHRARLRTWQLLCAIAPALTEESLNELSPLIMLKCVPINNNGSVRRLIENYLIVACKRSPVFLSKKLVELLSDVNARPQVAGSFSLVAAHFVREYWQKTELIADVLAILIRMCCSHQHLLRIISHITIHTYFTNRKSTFDTEADFVASLTPDMQSLWSYLDDSAESKKYLDKNIGAVNYDADVAMSPEDLFCMQRMEAEMWLTDTMPATTFHRFAFLAEELASIIGCNTPFEWYRCRMIANWISSASSDESNAEKLSKLTLIPRRPEAHKYFVDYAYEALYVPDKAVGGSSTKAAEGADADEKQDEQDNLQKKVVSWWNTALHNELHPRALGSNVKQSIVVVTTFLANPVNIAGLMRCGEIFAVEKVVVPNKNVFKHPHFIATARSAELWLPWEEVPQTGLGEYLKSMRTKGYTIVGVEQTADSVDMTGFDFPEKVVMVLGSEGQGVPASALHHLDVCVEIPQYGLIRSFNVHVTGALVLYEYTKQRMAVKKGGSPNIALPPAVGQ